MTSEEKRRKIIEVATAEIGTVETPKNSNSTKYGIWYGLDKVAWCATFVSWVYHHAGVPLGLVDKPKGYQYCPSAYNFWKRNRRFTDTPKAGDIVLFDFANKNSSDHTGIFVKMNDDGKTFETIEGNTSSSTSGSQSNGGMVCRKTRYISQVMAFVVPDVLVEGIPVSLRPVLCKKGDMGSFVSGIQKMLYDLKYDVVVDGDFGTKTETAIKKFQKENSLPVTGYITDNDEGALREALAPKPAKPNKITTGVFINKSDSGKSVVLIQEALNKKLKPTKIKVDGVFGDKTEKAVKAFQKKNKLTVDGVVGPETLLALGVKF